MTISHRLLAPKLFYFSWFAAVAALVPFIGLYYRAIDLSLTQIGLLASLPGLILLVSAPIWGLLADAFRLHRVLLPLAVAGTLVPVLLIGRLTNYAALLVLVAVQSLFTAPVVALADSATLTLLGADRERYGAQRFWGAVGWGLSTIVFGWLIERFGERVIFAGYAGLSLLTVAAALALPRSELPQVDLRKAVGALARDTRLAGLLGCALLIGCCSAVITNFLTLYLQDLGASGEQIGLAYTLASLSELPVMALSPLVLRRWGARRLLASAGLLYALRMAIYIALPTPGWALAAQLLHGLCFASLWTAGVVEVQRLAPAGLGATAQGLFGMAVFGVASALASAVGGGIYQALGAANLFGFGGVAALLGALGLVAGRYLSKAYSAGRSRPY
jgi:PPP family 3-phenylpropionic acid transporter